MIDSHAHIHDPKFDADRGAVLARAQEAGVGKMLTIGTSVEESYDAIRVAQQYPDVLRATVAVHPHEYSKLPDEKTREKWKTTIAEMAREDCVVGIGECGLDYHAFGGVEVGEEQRSCQRDGFRDHMDIASIVGKPLIVHARESYDDIKYEIENRIKRENGKRIGDKHTDNGERKTDKQGRGTESKKWVRKNGTSQTFTNDKMQQTTEYKKIPWIVLHCYQGDVEITKQFLELSDNIIFSFAGNVTYPVKKYLQGTKNDLREVLKVIPIERMLVETDCPYLAPQAYRGQRNEPAFVVETARFISEIKDIGAKDLERAIHFLFLRIFF